MTMLLYLEAENWIRNVFSAKAVGKGGVIHRATRDIERYAGRVAFMREVHRRGFTLVENGDQMVVFCNRDPVRLLLNRDPPKLSQRAWPTRPDTCDERSASRRF